MTVVFVFLGEFGYELFNWHAVVRKFRREQPRARVVCASRGDVARLYPGATYVDIGSVPLFRESVASGYFAVVPDPDMPLGSAENVAYDERLRAALQEFVDDELRTRRSRLERLLAGRTRFVFSSERTRLGSCRFGADRILFGSSPHEGDIYERLDLANNAYARIDADEARRDELERRLGASLAEPYVLVQTRRRNIWRRSEAEVGEARIVEALASRFRVVLLEFGEIRRDDSHSRFESSGVASRLRVNGFADQSCLVQHARANVFLTEGDFGSHIYVPPFLGRDVHAIAPRDVYGLGTTPISFWNEHVFLFGGKIDPIAAEDLDDDVLRGLVASL